MALTGSSEQMSKVGFSVADICAGMYALSSILAALFRRDRTGEGAAIELSMLECLTEWTSPQVLTAAATGRSPERSARRHGMIAPYGFFELSDGRTVLIALQSDREWAAMATGVLQQPELADDERFTTNAHRIANVAELEQIMRDVFAAMPGDEALERLRTSRIAVAAVRDPHEVWGARAARRSRSQGGRHDRARHRPGLEGAVQHLGSPRSWGSRARPRRTRRSAGRPPPRRVTRRGQAATRPGGASRGGAARPRLRARTDRRRSRRCSCGPTAVRHRRTAIPRR